MGAGRHYSATQPQPRLAIRCGRSNHHTSRPRSYSCVRVAQDLLLPLASVHRVMRKELTECSGAKVDPEAKLLMQETATEFVRFITARASKLARDADHKAVSGEDLINMCEREGGRHGPIATTRSLCPFPHALAQA